MATPQKGQKLSKKATKKAEEKPKKQAKPRKPRPKTYQMTAMVLAKETALLPEPLRSGVVSVAHAIIRFFQRAWGELTGVGAAEPAPRLLPPGSPRDDGEE